MVNRDNGCARGCTTARRGSRPCRSARRLRPRAHHPPCRDIRLPSSLCRACRQGMPDHYGLTGADEAGLALDDDIERIPFGQGVPFLVMGQVYPDLPVAEPQRKAEAFHARGSRGSKDNCPRKPRTPPNPKASADHTPAAEAMWTPSEAAPAMPAKSMNSAWVKCSTACCSFLPAEERVVLRVDAAGGVERRATTGSRAGDPRAVPRATRREAACPAC